MSQKFTDRCLSKLQHKMYSPDDDEKQPVVKQDMNNLPSELLLQILEFADPKEKENYRRVNKEFNKQYKESLRLTRRANECENKYMPVSFWCDAKPDECKIRLQKCDNCNGNVCENHCTVCPACNPCCDLLICSACEKKLGEHYCLCGYDSNDSYHSDNSDNSDNS